jgi:hypothetical protein
MEPFLWDVNYQDEYGRTDLMNAVLKQDYELIRRLFSLKANPYIKDKYGRTAMELVYNDINMIRELLNNGTDPNKIKNFGNYDYDTIKEFIKYGLDYNNYDFLTNVLYNCSDKTIYKILKNIEFKKEIYCKILRKIIGSTKNQEEFFFTSYKKQLIEYCGDINITNDRGYNILMLYLTSLKGDAEKNFVKFLISQGINLYHKTYNNETIIDIMHKSKSLKKDVVKEILINYNYTQDEEEKIIYIAKKFHCSDILLDIFWTKTKSEEDCQICFEKGANIKHNVGPHYFHKDCLYRWYSEKNNCPICRQSFGIKKLKKTKTRSIKKSFTNTKCKHVFKY